MYDRIVNPSLLIRRLNIVACNVLPGSAVEMAAPAEQLDLFSLMETAPSHNTDLRREQRRQLAVLDIKKRFGKNAILKGMNLEEGATAKDRNAQIGGHKA